MVNCRWTSSTSGTSSGLLPAPATCVWWSLMTTDAWRRLLWLQPICCEFATRVDYCNAVRYGVYQHKSHAVIAPSALPVSVYLRSTSVSRGQFRAWLKIHLFNQAYDILWEHFYFKSVLYLLIVTYCWAERERSGSEKWMSGSGAEAGHEKIRWNGSGAVSGGYWKRCERWAEISTAPATLTCSKFEQV